MSAERIDLLRNLLERVREAGSKMETLERDLRRANVTGLIFDRLKFDAAERQIQGKMSGKKMPKGPRDCRPQSSRASSSLSPYCWPIAICETSSNAPVAKLKHAAQMREASPTKHSDFIGWPS
jgi:hypothetical protein